jgi:hypothetical protein
MESSSNLLKFSIDSIGIAVKRSLLGYSPPESAGIRGVTVDHLRRIFGINYGGDFASGSLRAFGDRRSIFMGVTEPVTRQRE